MGQRRDQAPSASASKSQRERFIETARQLGCDEDEKAFDEKLRKIVKARLETKTRKAPR
jgi:hypothetical protein